ncbi:dienelactone hydrolase family protein [Methylopila sp. 73B]|uniref:alpha/beta hydrolase n=1 Tax=Methylopila sp. 73B TaxID=1120792 RepID=UPI00046448E8|nr:dienelactone hydrolase family protein [Methylopila sp. 73B]
MTSTPSPDGLVVLLHGVGSNGRDLLALAAPWRPFLPDISFVAPDGPFAFDQGPGRQWFSVAGVTPENRPARIAAARSAFDKVMRFELDRHGFRDRLDRVVLVGFSQGSMMALDAVACGRWPVTAAVAVSGRLASPTPYSPSTGTKILLLHGSSDPIVPSWETTRAEEVLRAEGLDVTSRIFPGLGHAISAEGASLARDFIAAALKPAVVA